MSLAGRLAIASPLVLLTVACGASDRDGDLLSDDFEFIVGSDPDLADTDGDGVDDATEHLSYFSPIKDDDRPYEGGYGRWPLPDSVAWDELREDAGWDEGDFSRSWDGEDQHRDTLLLKRFYGMVILVSVCSHATEGCRDAADGYESAYQERRPEGFVHIALLTEGADPDSAPDADEFADEFGLTIPVIEDEGISVAENYVTLEGGNYTIPSFTILGRDHVIRSRDASSPDMGLVDDLLEEDFPEVDYPLPSDYAELRTELGLLDTPHPDYLDAFVLDTGTVSRGGASGIDITVADGAPFGGGNCAAGGSTALLPLLLCGPALRRRRTC